jgi:hypothetical protein
VPLQPYQCAQCPTRTERSIYYSTLELPRDTNCTNPTQNNPCENRYTNRQWHERFFVANQYVTQIGVRVDYLQMASADSICGGEKGLTCNTIGSTGWTHFPLSQSAQANPARLLFSTTNSGTEQGADIGAASVCCSGSPHSGITTVVPMARYQGLLLGTGDVVYLRVPAQPSMHINLAMWGTQSGTDFDLYARCNALPTETQKDYYAWYGQQELIHIPGGCSGGNWYVAIHSHAGSGWFNFVQSAHYPAQHKVLTAGTGPHPGPDVFGGCYSNGHNNQGWSPDSTQIAMLKQQLRDAARMFYGATEGVYHFERIDFYNNNNCWTGCNGGPCNVCFTNCPNGRGGTWQHGVVINREYNYLVDGLAHEFGHAHTPWAEITDEYTGGWQRCGHSMMASNSYGNQFNMCNEWNNGYDNHPSATPMPPPSVWQRMYSGGHTPYYLYSTPDNFNYVGFDGDGILGVVP